MSGAFDIWLIWSDRILHVPEGVSALQVLRDAGVPVDLGCEHGSCGTCALNFVEGDVIHRDSCLSESAREREFCPCVSRALSRVVLPY
jgi:vanillate O-demethylase ferredoxin subunit